MDIFGVVDIPTWILVVLILATSFYIYSIYLNRKWDYLGLKGPTLHPIIGTMMGIFTTGFLERELEWEKKYGAVYRYRDFGPLSISISDPDMLRDVLVKHAHNFINRRDTGKLNDKMFDNIMTVLRDDQWKHVRQMVTPTFSSGKLRKMRPLITAGKNVFLKNLRRSFEEDKEFECKDVFSAFTLDTIVSTAFGVLTDTQENPDDPFIVNATKMMSRNMRSPKLILFFLCPWLAIKLGMTFADVPSVSFYDRAIDQMIEERRKNKDGDYKDFLQLALAANDEYEANVMAGSTERKGLSIGEVKSQCLLFFLAGFDTTSRILQYCGYHLATCPEWQENLIQEVDRELKGAEPDYDNTNKLKVMEMFVSEVLRMYPPGFRLERECADDITIGGQFIPKGVVVSVPVYAMHHDPKFYPDPEKFDPERFTAEAKANRNPYTYLPWGMGPRNCVGMRLAQLEIRMLLAAILQQFRLVKCEKTEVPLVMDKMKPLMAKNGIWAKAKARDSSEIIN